MKRGRCVVLSLACGALAAARGYAAGEVRSMRPPVVAGAFYPEDAETLRATVRRLLADAAVPEIKGIPLAAAAPHAGYPYSGRIAAHTFKALAALEAETIVIIGHDAHSGGVALLCPVDAYRTPLGDVPVDRPMIEALLAADSGIRTDRAIHAREHTVEVALPFLQVLGKSVRIVPALFGDPTYANAQRFAAAIEKAAGDRKVFVLASTDMSHYPTYADACRLDRETLDAVRKFDPPALFTHLLQTEAAQKIPNLRTAMCARGGMGTAMLFARARGADRAEVLAYANSGDAPAGTRDGVVGYCSAVFVKSR